MFTSKQLLEMINNHCSNLQFERVPKGLYSPIKYVLDLGGKRIRPILMLMAYNLYKEDVSTAFSPAIGIETYHNYTLLHDDLMDRADKRRGKPTVHQVWNDNTAILSGDAMLVLAYQLMANSPSVHLKEIIDLFSITALEICEGQQLDMEFEVREDVKDSEYIEMIRLKTAVLLASSLKIGAILAGASVKDAQHLYDFGIQIGLAFQIKDDFLDTYGNTAIFGKNIGGDILCNKKTYLLVKAFEKANQVQKEELRNWMSDEKHEAKDKIEGVTQLYNQLGVKTICEDKMKEYYTKGIENLASIGVEENKKKELKDFAEHLMYREM
ncbi:MAG: polyprenyl synthetase family protein [Bacteroidaceae bacterium]